MKFGNRTVFLALLLILVGVVLYACYPLLRPGFFVSDDGAWMIIRLSAFYQSLREGQFPVRFLGRLNFGYGYPVANFLYPGFMYIGSVIHLLGFPFVSTVKIILGGSLITGTLFVYLWLRTYFKKIASAVGTIGFITAPYLLFDLYHRGSVGEILAIAAGAIGLYSIKAKKPWLFGIAVPLLIVSHNTVALLFLGFYALYISVLGAWRDYWVMFGTGMAMAAFFWIPALYERKYVVFDSIAVSQPGTFFVQNKDAALLGIAGLIAAIMSLFSGRQLRKEKIYFLCVAAGVIFLSTSVSASLWGLQGFAKFIQFPYRFLSLGIFTGAWLMAYAVEYGKKLFPVIVTVLCIGLGVWTIRTQIQGIEPLTEPEGYYTTNEATTNVADEYMPKWVSIKPIVHASERLLFYSGRGTITPNVVTSQMVDVVVDAAEVSSLQINTVYYPGWGASVDDTQVRIDYANSEGVIRISVPAGTHHVVVAFRETISRFLADMVSLVGIALYVTMVIIGFLHKKKNK